MALARDPDSTFWFVTFVTTGGCSRFHVILSRLFGMFSLLVFNKIVENCQSEMKPKRMAANTWKNRLVNLERVCDTPQDDVVEFSVRRIGWECRKNSVKTIFGLCLSILFLPFSFSFFWFLNFEFSMKSTGRFYRGTCPTPRDNWKK